MRILFHPDFRKDVRKFERDYKKISEGLGARFRAEVTQAIAAIREAPGAAGHFLQTGSKIVPAYRRRNLRSFPFFVLYGETKDALIVGSLIPSRSDPLMWLARFGEERT